MEIYYCIYNPVAINWDIETLRSFEYNSSIFSPAGKQQDKKHSIIFRGAKWNRVKCEDVIFSRLD
jgi:hypothetical protein